jgi:hypothetical protein
MDKKKGLVYDSQKYFSRLLKYNFQKDFEFDVYRNFEYFDDELKDYSVIVFAVHSEEELSNFVRIYNSKIPFVVCTFNKRILRGMENLANVFILDTSGTQPEMRNKLQEYFHCAIPNM